MEARALSSHAPFDQPFAHSVYAAKYARPGEDWNGTVDRVTKFVMGSLYATPGMKTHKFSVADHTDAAARINALMRDRHFIPGGRYLYASGNDFHQTNNCLLLRCEDSREGWADMAWKTEMALLTGAGIGIYWGDLRARGSKVRRTGGVASGPVPKAIATNEQGRAAVQGGNRRCAIWGGLNWDHGDIFEWITAKDWPTWLREQKLIDPSTPAPLDSTNISVCLDDNFFSAYHDPAHPMHDHAQKVYWMTVEHMVTKGEPGFSVDLGDKVNEKLRNACTEIVSEDDSDVCNLGGLVLSRFTDPQQFGAAVRDSALFLTAGTVYSDVPYPKVAEVREKNRRLGLDLIGVHEFLLQRGLQYGTDDAFAALDPYMREYERALEYAHDWQDRLGLSKSVAATSGAPTGTRGIIAESTTGWEPVYAAAYKRIVRDSHGRGERRDVQYVVDPTVKRLVDQGVVAPDAHIEDACSLAYNYERRFAMQAFAQAYTDQAISMTINLPYVMKERSDQRAFGDTLIEYLPQLRGITVYPDGAIPGQPITAVPLSEALGKEGVVFEEEEAACASGACGV